MSWEKTSDDTYRMSKGGNRADVISTGEGWKAHIEYADGTGEDSPIYGTIRSAKDWVSRKIGNRGIIRKKWKGEKKQDDNPADDSH